MGEQEQTYMELENVDIECSVREERKCKIKDMVRITESTANVTCDGRDSKRKTTTLRTHLLSQTCSFSSGCSISAIDCVTNGRVTFNFQHKQLLMVPYQRNVIARRTVGVTVRYTQ